MLENVQIAKPCPADWNAMTGDERVRFCQQCKLNVYNLSAMTRREGEALIARTEGKVCVRLYQRADGTVITQDCPVGLAALRKRVAKLAASVFALVALGFSAIARANEAPEGRRSGAGADAAANTTSQTTIAAPSTQTPHIMGKVMLTPKKPPRVFMGEPTRPPKKDEKTTKTGER